MITLQALCFGILGYLLGATPYGLIIARVFCHTDPRTATIPALPTWPACAASAGVSPPWPATS